jgi:hypothetical protein
VPDPYRKLQYGQVVDFRTVTWNAMLEAALAQKARQHDRRVPERPSFRQSGVIRVKNESDRDLSRGHVLGLDRPIFTPGDSEDAFLREVAFRGVVPTVDHRGRFCVTLDPIGAGRIGRAYVSGVCQVRVDVTGPFDQYADIIPDETGMLRSADAGSAQILWMETEDPYGYGHGYAYDGEDDWAIVRLGPPCGGYIGVTTEDIDAPVGLTWSSGTARLYDDGGDTPRDLGVQTVYLWFSVDIPSGTKVRVNPGRGGKLWIDGADCNGGGYYS